MNIEKINISNFKNLKALSLDFSPTINCILGENGSGKTNILDAIHYICLTKSGVGSSDSQSVNFDSDYFRIESKLTNDIKVECTFSAATKKSIKIDAIAYSKMSEHIGKFPLVMIAPDDTDLIREGSEIRRKFIDGIICQLNPDYLDNLITYNYVLKQRNSLLKSSAESRRFDEDEFEPYNNKLLTLNKLISTDRQLFIAQLIPIMEHQYDFISSSKEKAKLTYESIFLDPDFDQIFRKSIDKDLQSQRTLIGIHTDDYEFTINDQSIKKTASQGQKKSFVIALKLAQFQILKQAKKQNPLLLLDDIFDKLDDERIEKLINLIANNSFGQIFITDARPERSEKIFKPFKTNVKNILLKNGQLVL